MKSPDVDEIDLYISGQPSEVQVKLSELRALIKKAAPNAEEVINYNIPAFSLVPGGKRDQQVMMAGYKKHIGFYPHPSVIEQFYDQLTGYKYAKGSVQFLLGKPLPKDLILNMVRYRLLTLDNE